MPMALTIINHEPLTIHYPPRTIWLVVSTPLKNMSSSVGIGKFPTERKVIKIHVPNHQPAISPLTISPI